MRLSATRRRGPAAPRRARARAGVAVEFLGVLLLLGAGVFWLGGALAKDTAARYSTAPLCTSDGPTPCRAVLPATVVRWSAPGASRRSVTVRLGDNSTRTLIVAGGDLFAALQTDLPVQAEVWTGQVIRLTDNADHVLISEDDPTQASYDNSFAALLGALGLALVILGIGLWRAARR